LQLLHAEADATVFGVDFQHLHFNFVTTLMICEGCFTRFVQLISETWIKPSTPSAISMKAPYSAKETTLPLEFGCDWEFCFDCFPRIRMQLLQTQRKHALFSLSNLSNFHLDLVTPIDEF